MKSAIDRILYKLFGKSLCLNCKKKVYKKEIMAYFMDESGYQRTIIRICPLCEAIDA